MGHNRKKPIGPALIDNTYKFSVASIDATLYIYRPNFGCFLFRQKCSVLIILTPSSLFCNVMFLVLCTPIWTIFWLPYTIEKTWMCVVNYSNISGRKKRTGRSAIWLTEYDRKWVSQKCAYEKAREGEIFFVCRFTKRLSISLWVRIHARTTR